MASLNVAGVNSGAAQVDFVNPQARQQTPPTASAAVEDRVTLSNPARSGVQLHVATTGQTSQKNGTNAQAVYLSNAITGQDKDHDGDNQ